MLPLVHNTIVRNRSNTMPSSPNRSNNSMMMFSLHNSSLQASPNDASTSYSTQQYGGSNSKENDSECKKLKSSKVCISANRAFLKKRSLTLSSLFSPKSSRSASTNSLNQNLVDETIASVLRKRPLSELTDESNKTVSEQNLNQSTSSYFQGTNSNLCKSNSVTNSVTSTSTDENVLDNLISSSNDLNSINSNSNSTSDLNINRSIPSFPPPPYTQFDRLKRSRPFLFRSQSAPQHRSPASISSLDQHSNNPHVLENIEEIADSTDINNQVLSELAEENEDEMTSKRNSLIDHQFICRLAHEKETVPISGFNTRKELYEKISEAFKISIDQVS